MSVLEGFKIKIAEPKRIRSSSTPKLISGIVVEDGNTFKVKLESGKLLDFTPSSFELTDRMFVFTKNKNEYGHRTTIIRDSFHAKFFPGLKKQYLPFDDKKKVKGYIVDNMFQFTELDLNLNEHTYSFNR